MALRSILLIAKLVFWVPVLGKKDEQSKSGGGKARSPDVLSKERRPLYSPWSDEDSIHFWNADNYMASDDSGPRLRLKDRGHTDSPPHPQPAERPKTDQGHKDQPHHPQQTHRPRTAVPSVSEIKVPLLPPLERAADKSVIVMRELLHNLAEEDYMNLAKQISHKYSLGDASQAETVVLLRQDFDLIKHIKRAPVLEAAVGYGNPDLPPVKVPRWPDATAKRLEQMLGTILDKATRAKPAGPVTGPKLRALV